MRHPFFGLAKPVGGFAYLEQGCPAIEHPRRIDFRQHPLAHQSGKPIT